LYRIRPTVAHWGDVPQGWTRAVAHRALRRGELPPSPLRWDPCRCRGGGGLRRGVRTVTTAGDASAQSGWRRTSSSPRAPCSDEYFYNADGEMLFVPQQGALRLWTEFGIVDARPARWRSSRAA
jgi:homogentisate 1,2-dioxygenase